MRANERTHFDATDLDKSGGLSLKEYVTGLLHVPLAAEREGAAEKVVHEQVEDADKNGPSSPPPPSSGSSQSRSTCSTPAPAAWSAQTRC